MQMQGIMLALVSVYGMQMICKYLNLDPTVAMGLQVGAALILPRFAAKFLTKTVAGEKAPPLESLQYVQGEPLELGNGKVNVVEFWATWCPPCKTSIPHLNDMYLKYKEKGVGFVGVTGETPEAIKPFLAKTPAFTYPCACDPGNKSISAYGVSGIPAAFVVGKDGTVLWQGHPMQGLDEAVKKALTAEPSATKQD